MSESLSSKTIKGIKWNYFFTILNVIGQLISTTVLARLLFPRDYGLIAIANIVLGFGAYIAQMGVGPALIQKRDVKNEDIISAYAIAIVLSSVLVLLVIFIAPLFNTFFEETEIVKIIQVMSLAFIFMSLSRVSISLLQKEFKFFLIGILSLISFVIGSILTPILFALLGYGVWSLVSSVLVHNFILAALTLFFVRDKIRLLPPRLLSIKSLISYGGKYSLSSFIEYFTYRMDAILIGHYFSSSSLGYYNRGSLLVQLPAQYISTNLIKVLFPTLNEVKENRVRFYKYYSMLTKLLGTILFGVCIFISINANEIVILILGDKWTESIGVLRFLSLAIPFHLLINYQGLVYDVYNYLSIKLIIKIFHLIFITLIFLFLIPFGIEGIAFGFLVTESLLYVVYTTYNKKLLNINIRKVIDLHLPFLTMIILVGIPSYLLKSLLDLVNINILFSFTIELIVVPTFVFVIIIYFTPRPIKSMLFDLYQDIGSNSQNNITGHRKIDSLILKIIKKIVK